MPTRASPEHPPATWRGYPPGFWPAVVCGLSLGALAGCPSTSVYRTADPVKQGAWQVGVSADLGAFSDVEQQTRSPAGSVELTVRRGLTDNVDLGVKLYTFGLEANATWRVRKRRWSWALAPYVAGLRTANTLGSTRALHLFTGSAVIASRPLSTRWTFATGPFVGYGLYQPETGGVAHGVWLGGFAHFDRAVGKRSHITPELGLYRVVVGEVPVRGAAVRLGAAWRIDL